MADAPDPSWWVIGEAVVGTTMAVPEIAERYQLDEEDVEHQLGLLHVEVCGECGWWCKDTLIDPEMPLCDDCDPA